MTMGEHGAQVRPVEGNWATYSKSGIPLRTSTSFTFCQTYTISSAHPTPLPRWWQMPQALSSVAMGLRTNLSICLSFWLSYATFAKDFRLKTCGRKKNASSERNCKVSRLNKVWLSLKVVANSGNLGNLVSSSWDTILSSVMYYWKDLQLVEDEGQVWG